MSKFVAAAADSTAPLQIPNDQLTIDFITQHPKLPSESTQMRNAMIYICLCLTLSTSFGREVQNHGLWFEHWLCDSFFDGYRAPNYTQKWDIPAAVNRNHGNLPVNPKATKYGSPIGLGDAIRQFDLIAENQSFILIVGFWDQADPTTKRWTNVQATTITPAIWAKLWHPITRTDLEKLDHIIKDTTLSIEQARQQAQALKNQAPFNQAIITLNPKIDRSQRRLQCSLGFTPFFQHLTPQADSSRQQKPNLWGKTVPDLPQSTPRQFQNPTP